MEPEHRVVDLAQGFGDPRDQSFIFAPLPFVDRALESIARLQTLDHQRTMGRIQLGQIAVELGGHHRRLQLGITEMEQGRDDKPDGGGTGDEWRRDSE